MSAGATKGRGDSAAALAATVVVDVLPPRAIHDALRLPTAGLSAAEE